MTIANALSGVRVLDMTRILAGPYCSMLLADAGADVIKVEHPTKGDDTRSWGPPFHRGLSTYFASVNRNKRSVAIDFKTQRGANLIRKLAARSDVVIENFVGGHLKKYDLDFDTLSRLNDRLVYCSISGYGQSGEYSNKPLFDVAVAALGGFIDITGPRDGEPCKAGVAVTDLMTGTHASAAICMSLLNNARSATPQPIHLDCNLLNTQLAMLTHVAAAYLNADVKPQRWGTAHANIVPYQGFRTSDGRYVIVAATSELQFERLCRSLGATHLLNDERYADNGLRVKHRSELCAALQDVILEYSSSDIVALLEENGVPTSPVNSIEDAFNHPQVKHNRCVIEAGDFRLAAPAISAANRLVS